MCVTQYCIVSRNAFCYFREDALKCFNDILNLEPQFLRGNEVMLRLGILYLKKGNYDAALDVRV